MSSELRFDNKVVVVTGAGGGLGKQYATFFASRGASVVVNDLGGSLKGDDSNSRVADKVVEEIRANGGKAVANYDNVENGDKIVETAVKNFGTVHIVINNAGILRDVSFKNMKDQDWDLIYNVHLYGSYKVAKAAWPYMRKQKFGKIINTASAAGLYGNFGQTNYSAAKLALVGFTETLAKEGAKYNITANAITPLAASRMTETIMPQDILDKLKPEYVVPVVAYLVHEDTTETWGIYEVGAGAVTKVRWERAAGALLKPDDSLTPSALLKQWEQVNNFEGCTHPDGPNDFLSLAEKVQSMPSNEQGETISYKDQVIIVTGAGAGLGRAYALLLGKLGAKVVVNDFADPQPVVDEIKKAGGTAVGDKSNVVEGHKVVQTAVDNFGTVHGVINNAGILRDKSFQNISEDEWNAVIAVHLKGTYAVTKAAWPYFLKQKYGRVVNTTSTSGIYGNFGQSNYAAAKLGILGFSRALALEGKKYNIFVNTIAPNAGTNMTKGVFTEEMLEMFKPEFVAPTPVLLCSDKAPTTGDLFEVGMGWVGRTRWQRTGGVAWGSKNPITAEKVAAKWDQITNFDDGRATNPASTQESSMGIFELATNAEEQEEEEGSGSGEESEVGIYSYDHKQIILYNLGVGAKATDLPYVYENNENFGPVPTFGVLPYFTVPLDYSNVVKNYNPMKLLHGEQYLEICKWPIPQSATIETKQEVLDVVDKGKAAVVIAAFHSYDKETGEKLFYNVGSFFLRGSGGFGGPAKAKDRGAITAANKPPQRKPDFQTEYHISEDLAALYRLSGDFNPLHIDPDFAAVGNFPKPILHGLCTLGISARLLVDKYGVFKNVKVRFSGHVFPGETLQIAAWKEGNKVIFESYVKERQTTAISAAALEYSSNGNAKL